MSKTSLEELTREIRLQRAMESSFVAVHVTGASCEAGVVNGVNDGASANTDANDGASANTDANDGASANDNLFPQNPIPGD
jgi:hypothetical protein